MQIEPYAPHHLDAVLRLAVRAWAPVFESLQNVMDPDVYREFYPDWRASQKEAVEAVCRSEGENVWVAVDTGSVVGFMALRFHAESRLGEIYMLAVDPDRQRRGIGTALTEFALDQMRAAGMIVAMVETGGDSGHAPARGAYEKAGFSLLPIARYFRKL